jgi:ApaG protein
MKNNLKITATVTYMAQQSDPKLKQFVFRYTIRISNLGTIGAQLRSRHWFISDETGHVDEVVGDGVIGKQPYLSPGEHFEYTSGAILKTATGVMAGYYTMLNNEGEKFKAVIEPFILSEPYTIH